MNKTQKHIHMHIKWKWAGQQGSIFKLR